MNSLATPPGPGGNADIPLESAVERSLGLIADFGSSLRDTHTLRIEKARRRIVALFKAARETQNVAAEQGWRGVSV